MVDGRVRGWSPKMPSEPVAYATPVAYGQTMASKKTGMAVASMVLGIVAILVFWIPLVGWLMGFVLSLLAIVLGGVAMGNANKRPGEFGGKGMAITGLVLGIIAIGLMLLFAILVASFFAALFG